MSQLVVLFQCCVIFHCVINHSLFPLNPLDIWVVSSFKLLQIKLLCNICVSLVDIDTFLSLGYILRKRMTTS